MPAKLTRDDVLMRFKEHHGDGYDYRKFIYQGAGIKGTVVCPAHGDFQIQAGHHMKGVGCSKCAADRQKITREAFITRSKQTFGNSIDYGKVPSPFPGSASKITLRCKEHNLTFTQAANAHLSGHYGCAECKSDMQRGPKGKQGKTSVKDATKLFVKKAKVIHGEQYDYTSTKYRKMSGNIIIICREHGAFEQLPSNHLKGSGCARCGASKQYADSVKAKCKALGVDYHRTLKRLEAGMPDEKAYQEGYVHGDKTTSTEITVYGVTYPNIRRACDALTPKASSASILRWLKDGLKPEEAFERDPKPGFGSGLLYKITQKSTGKVYIGQTVQELCDRWDGHIRAALMGAIKSKASLSHAIRTFGPDDFDPEELERAESADELQSKEIALISKHNSLKPNGFNLNRGGSTGGSLRKSCIVDSKLFDSVGDAVIYIAGTRGISLSAAAKRYNSGRIDVKTPAPKGKSKVKTKEYKAWSLMKDTISPTSKTYVEGMEAYPAWKDDFDVWLTDVGMAPTKKHRFCRVDKSLGFLPGNCRWLTPVEDAECRVASGQILFNGVKPRHCRPST